MFGGGPTNSYFFVTQHGLIYEVKFKPSDYLFADYPTFHDAVFELVIEVAESTSGQRIPPDSLIAATIARIFLEFFQDRNRVIVYICDSSDARESARYRKFNSWFEQFQVNLFLKVDVHLTDRTSTIYTSLILHRDNPNLSLIIEAFNEITRGGESTK